MNTVLQHAASQDTDLCAVCRFPLFVALFDHPSTNVTDRQTDRRQAHSESATLKKQDLQGTVKRDN